MFRGWRTPTDWRGPRNPEEITIFHFRHLLERHERPLTLSDQVLQFGAIVTDDDLNELERFEVL